MSRLDVMYHQSYGAHRYLPATSATAAAIAYKAAYFHRQQQQQRKLCSYSRMQDSVDQCAQGRQTQTQTPALPRHQGERRGEGEEPPAKDPRPAEAEYLSSRCVLFTYFQGDIGDVVDEHFSRALSQPSQSRGSPRGLFREGGALGSGQCGSFPASLWGSGYPTPGSSRLSSLHPDFPPSGAFQSSDPAAWAGHGLAPPPAEPWHFPLASQSSTGYAHVHELYPHVHTRHTHHHHTLHHAHSPALDARFGSLLLPGVCTSRSPAPHGEGGQSEPDATAHGWAASFHGSLDAYESALDQEKAKAPVWF